MIWTCFGGDDGESDDGEGTMLQKETRCLFLVDESFLRTDLTVVPALAFDASVNLFKKVSSDSKAVIEFRFLQSMPGVMTEL